MTTNDQNPTAGIGDPYWYEWTIGQNYVIDMLNPDNGIESVTLQATEAQGLDDVVVVYMDGSAEYVQVKHTRKESTITFGNILPLLKSMSNAWVEQKSKWIKCKPVLFSNRNISTSSIKMESEDGTKYVRPALDEFLTHFKSEVKEAITLVDVDMPTEWLIAWSEWCEQLNELSNEEKLEFFKLLEVKGNQPNLDDLTIQVTQKISETFGISSEKATSIFSQLDHALREWGTTFRGEKESINCEDVYEVLSLTSQELVGDHMLYPPEPFFPSRQQFLDNLVTELLSGDKPVVFLTGLPGQGKTSIVSALANRREPIIDLRYHAFKPITPHTKSLPADAGVTTKAEVLWGDLLTELRSFFFKGRLAKYNVPIRNDFLTLEQLISEVLRLADILGQERGRPTIIAIDGIDHAARASVDQYSFLDTLIPPDAVPPHVRFLIVGQPAEAYEKYPFWLKDNTNGVANWVVDSIHQEDIYRLISTEVPGLTSDQLKATVRLINSVSQGNTLAAIFAIEEAKMVSNIEDLQFRLQNRQLSNGVSVYYESIWSAAVTRLEERFLFVGQRLAAVLSPAKEKIKGQELAKIFLGVLDISSADWTECLRALRPLLVEDIDGFRVTHNDIRVHLTKQIHAHPERLREVASLISDFYRIDPGKMEARHTCLFELLRMSNRYEDIPRVFTPDYIMEGFAIDRPIQELQDQCKEALLNVVATGDWNCVHIVSCAATTLMQLYKSVDWMDRRFEYFPELPPVLFSEGRVPNQESWTLDMVYNTMVDTYRLIQVSEWDRANGLMRRWFGEITPIHLANLLKDFVYVRKEKNVNLNDIFEQVLYLWGKISYHIGLCWDQERESYQTDDIVKQEIWAHFSDAMMEEALEFGGVRDWIICNQLAVYRSINKVEINLMKLANKRRWAEVAYTLKGISENYDKLPDTFQIKSAALSLLAGNKQLFETWVRPIVDKGFKSLENIDRINNLEDHTFLYCMVSFVLGWTQPHRNNSGIAEDGAKNYYQKSGDNLQRGHLSALLRGSALVGKWLGVYRRRGKDAAQLIVTPIEVNQVLTALIGRSRNYNELAYNHQKATRPIIELMIDCSSVIGGEAEKIVYEFIKGYCQSYPINYLMEMGWRYLWNRGEEELLVEWFNYWCGPEGAIWHSEISERTDVVERLSDLADEIGLQQEAKKARQLLKWGMIGYTGHKEYVLDSPKEWYKELDKIEPGIWRNQGKLLLEICQEASEIGDNRSAIFVEAVVAGSVAREGATAMWSMLNSQNMKEPLIENISMIFDGLIIALETLDLTELELLSIWSFAIGALDLNSGHERCYFEDLKKAILLVAKRNGINSLDEKLEVLGPSEYQVIGDRDRYRIPSRWFEEEDFTSSEEKKAEGFYQSLIELQMDEAISKLVELAESEDSKENLWLGIYVITQRLKKEKPYGYPVYLKTLAELLLTYYQYPYVWSGSHLYLAFQEIIPLVRDSVRFDLLKKVIENIDFEKDERIWIGAAAENLDDFCRFRAVSTGNEDLSEGLQRQLVLHEKWILGNGFLPDMKRINVPDYQPSDSIPQTWSEFATHYWFKILQSNNLTRIELALRGLWSIAQVNPRDLTYIVEQWDCLSVNVKEKILLLVERAAASNTTVYELFSEIVHECFFGVELGLKLQAWVILQSINRRKGEVCPDFQLSKHPEYELYLSSQTRHRGILDIPSIERGLVYELQGSDIVHSLINRLGVVTGGDVEDIEHKFVAYADVSPINVNHEEPLQIKRGQIGIRNSPHWNLLMRVIYHELYSGRWKEVPIAALAQALLKSDDPFVFLQSPLTATDAKDWPIDYELEKFKGNKKLILERTLPHLHAGLSDDEVVLAGVLQSYSWSTDIEVIFNTSFHAKGFEFTPINNMTTINGRTFALYYDDRYDPTDINEPVQGMTYKAGGIGEFINQSMLCYPSLIWSQIFNWYPSIDNPLIWLEEGFPVVRFEHLLGRTRDSVQDQLHRQPFLQRWVCSKKVFEMIKTEWDISISSVSSVNVRRKRR
jgi:hypothetical protein